MTRIEKAVDDFFENYGDMYDSHKDLQVMWLYGGGVLVAAPWEGVEVGDDISLGLSFESNDYAGFIEAFSIKRNVASAIKRITARDLMNLYLSGKGSVTCGIGDDGQILWFQRMTNGRMRVTDVYDTEHELTQWLEAPQQFMEYTRQYYKVGKHPKEYLSLKTISLEDTCLVNN